MLLFLLLRRHPAPPAAPHKERGAPVPISGPQTIAALDRRIARLEQLRTWMGEDPDLGRLIDATIGAQVRTSERCQRIFSGCVAVASLAVGWILNAVSLPAIVVGLFGH
ncbi:MAG TPA: hypothetical protein VGS80_19035 [Ktedonobacterales bacterium]|nr:hypothetical protein [Ktedonobacterales bacterium]